MLPPQTAAPPSDWDKKFGTEDSLVAIEGQGLRAYIPVPDMDHRTEFFSAEQFSYAAERNVYVCPAGKELGFDQAHSTERQLRYRARAACATTVHSKRSARRIWQGRTLCRSVNEECLDRVHGYTSSEAYQKASLIGAGVNLKRLLKT